MAVTVTIESQVASDPADGLDSTQSSIFVSGRLTLSGNYGEAAANGDVIDFSGVPAGYGIKSPCLIFQEPTAGNEPVIYLFLYARGTDITDGKLQVIDYAGAQITEGAAYPAALTEDDPSPNILFKAEFVKIL